MRPTAARLWFSEILHCCFAATLKSATRTDVRRIPSWIPLRGGHDTRMRALLPIALVAFTSFAAGFAGMRSMSARAARVQERQPILPALVEPVATPAVGADHSPVASRARITGVLALADKERSLSDDHALFLAISKLEAPDFLAGAEEMLALFKKSDTPYGSANLALSEAWMERWLEVDAAHALRFLETLAILKEPPTGRSLRSLANSVQGGLFAVLARRQPEWTQQYLSTLKPGAQREVGVHQLLNETAQQNPAKAGELLVAFSEGAERRAAVHGYVTGLAAVDVRAGFEIAAGESAGPFRKELLQAVLREAAERGIGIVRELLERVEDAALRRELVGDSAREISWRSREDLLPWLMEEAQQMSSTANAQDGFDPWHGAVAQALRTSGDPARAMEWAATLPNDPEKKLLLSLIGGWDQRDNAVLRSWLANHSETLDAAVLEKLRYTLADLARRDGPGTRAWAAALPPGPLREQAHFQIALSSAAEGDDAPATAAYASVAARDTSGVLAKQLASALATKDGAAAAKWAMALPMGPARAAALSTVAEQWSQRDPRGAAEWLAQMPPGSERDSAVHEYAAKVVFADPFAAAEWVEQVADPATRGKAAEAVFSTWSREDSIASRAWLRALPGVDETWRADFLRKAK